jgi:hypothetical protein
MARYGSAWKQVAASDLLRSAADSPARAEAEGGLALQHAGQVATPVWTSTDDREDATIAIVDPSTTGQASSPITCA